MSVDYAVNVKTLCEFTARSGDLSTRFTPSPTAEQGIAGHQVIGSRRAAGYQREVTVRGRYKTLRISGRADGYDPVSAVLEEFKTHRGDLARMPANQRGLHWAQLKIYGALFCAERQLQALDLRLVYFDIETDVETCLTERCSAQALATFFDAHCERFLGWALRETAHRRRRDDWLAEIRFPYTMLRAGQRRMAESIYRAALSGGTLMVQAPTGLGKTLGALYPMLKAVPRKALDKVFFLVAKTSGRRLALAALKSLHAALPAALRILEMSAKAAVCHFPGRACEADSCPLARGFYDRLAAARSQALEAAVLDRSTLDEVALAHRICPYYLGQELTRWCDVIIADYNYYFNGGAILHALTVQNRWRVGVLVDEAHCLLPRARDMYSVRWDQAHLDAVRAVAPPAVAAPLAELEGAWDAVRCAQLAAYAVLPAIPVPFIAVLRRVTAAIGDALGAEPANVDATLLQFFFEAVRFCRLIDTFGPHSLFDVTRRGGQAVLCIRCINPGVFLEARFAAGTTTALFSATLNPPHFFRSLLGLPQTTPWVEIESPFDPGQLEVRVEAGISTRFQDRRRSLGPLVELISQQYRARPGNYLAFLSSFDYLEAVSAKFSSLHPATPIWVQRRSMSPLDREAYLERFSEQGRGIGFAVLGGVFAEGIDLPGTRLIGAFIATLGLPQFNPVNAEIERRMQSQFGSGYEFTYLYPGVQRVIQAAGRVIRTSTDEGTVVLIDDRYRDTAVRKLLPDTWRIR